MTKEELKTHLKGLSILSDKERPQRIKRAKVDFRYAVMTYFPHHVSEIETSIFRKTVYKDIGKILKNKKSSFESYRGAAKTTLITRLLTLWLTAIRKKKRHAVIISSTLDVSKETLEFIKTELEDNQRLISDFEIAQGVVWSSEEIIFSSSEIKIRLKVYGAGKKIRGANWLGFRPDLIVCDDTENDENVESKNQRDKLYKWFIKAIMKLPSRQSTDYNIIVVGTKLHHDGLLARLQQREDFINYRFPLVLAFPSNIDELDKRDISKKAVKDMILDDTALDKLELLKEYLEDKESFMSEFQNEPLSKDGTTFSLFETFESMPICDSYTIGIDPALGKNNGDYFAICTLGYSMTTNKFYATVRMYKLKATVMIDKIIALYINLSKEQKPIKIAIETVQFQEFFKDILEQRTQSIGLYLPIVPIKNTTNKELRIDALSPLINNQTILIDKNSHTFIEELETYPKSAHDDGLDSLEMAYKIAKKPAFSYQEAYKNLKLKESETSRLNRFLPQRQPNV